MTPNERAYWQSRLIKYYDFMDYWKQRHNQTAKLYESLYNNALRKLQPQYKPQ